ncbi:MAG: YggT family protein [Rickettsiales bacterium]|nr:MAG: YggT family protein [Rickettsiales bacterium]
MNLNPFIDLLANILDLYKFAITVWIILSWLIAFGIVNRHQNFVERVMYMLRRLIDPVLEYIRRYIPNVAGIDLSAIVLFLLIGFVKNLLYTYLYT